MKTIVERLEKRLIEKGYSNICLVNIEEFTGYKSKIKQKIYEFVTIKDGQNMNIELDRIDKTDYQLWQKTDEQMILIDDIKL